MKNERNNGITLIALVVTIIVLLILAGISIAMLSGNNGILQRATDAKTYTDNSQIQEQINLAYHSSLVDGQGKVTELSLESELKKEFNKTSLYEGWLDKTSVEGKWRITIDGVSLDVPAGTDETGLSNDESKKLYNALKDKTIEEILNGMTIDGIEIKYMGGSTEGIIIEYNNQLYTISINQTDYSVTTVTLTEGFMFFIRGQAFEARDGMTFGQWIEEYSPSGVYIGIGYGEPYVITGNEIIVYDPTIGQGSGDCTSNTVIVQNRNYLTYHQ